MIINQDKNNIKERIRIILVDEKGRQISYCRKDEKYSTSVDDGYEDLSLVEDATKIALYQNSEYLDLANNKTYKVVKRSFQPCSPVTLHLYLREVEDER